MKPGLRIETTAGVIDSMTPEQFSALQDLVGAGQWDSINDPVEVIGCGDYIGVQLPGLFIGIERDGYSHS